MTEKATKEKATVPAPTAAKDLSRELEQAMERQPDEYIKAVLVFDDFYRCNWWVKDKSPRFFWLTSGTIRKSMFLRAKRTSDGLLIEQM